MFRRVVIVFALVSVVLGAAGAALSRRSAYRIPASIPSDCSVDVTSQLLSWFGSVPDNSVLSFGAGGCYRIEGTLELRYRKGLDFEGNGATFRSFNPPDDQRAIWRVVESSGIVFRNMTIIGSYANGGTLDESLQHAHAIDLRGTSAEVANVAMSNLAGDCVYFGLGYSSTLPRSSGSVHDSTCTGTSRNAVSVVAGDDVLVTRLTTDRIGLTTFDVDPNNLPGNGSQRATFDNNKIGSYYRYAFAVIGNEPISDQAFTNNTVTGRGLRIGILPGAGYRPLNVSISGNTAVHSQVPASITADDVDTLTITSNSIPLTSGTMAAIDNSCGVTVTGNRYRGGNGQDTVINTPAWCSR